MHHRTDEVRDKAPSPNCPLLMRVSLWYQRNNCCHESLYMHHRMDEARDKAPLLILNGSELMVPVSLTSSVPVYMKNL